MSNILYMTICVKFTLHFALDQQAQRYYKLVANKHPQIPDWHNGKGERGWLFVDELFFYE